MIKFRFSSIIINYSFSKNVFNSNIINKQCSSCFRRCHKSDMLLMAGRHASFFTVLFLISRLFPDIASQQCGAGGDLYSIYQMMLQGHTYKTFKTAPGTLQCRDACLADVRCQSYNIVMFIAICEGRVRGRVKVL